MSVRVAINGFGRIGRNVMRAGVSADADIEFVAVNDLTDAQTLAHLLRYDSVHGKFHGDGRGRRARPDRGRARASGALRARPGQAAVEGPRRRRRVRVHRPLHEARGGAQAPRRRARARVVITAPAKDADLTICIGVNDDQYDPAKHQIISNASCTTNCLAPVAKVLQRHVRHRARLDDDDPLLHATTSRCSTCRTRTCAARARRR